MTIVTEERKLSWRERLHGSISIEHEVLAPPEPEVDLEWILQSPPINYAPTSDEPPKHGLIVGNGKITLEEDPAVVALNSPRDPNPELEKALAALEDAEHEITIKLPKTVKVPQKDRKFYASVVRHLITKNARHIMYSTDGKSYQEMETP